MAPNTQSKALHDDPDVNGEQEIVRLEERHLHSMLVIEHSSFESPWCSGDFESAFRDSRTLCLGLQLRGKLIGYAIGYLQIPPLHLANLAVGPEYRRRGYGLTLVQRIICEGVNAGCTGCTLEVRASNERAQRLYHVLGFETIDVWPRHYSGPVEDGLIMYRGSKVNG